MPNIGPIIVAFIAFCGTFLQSFANGSDRDPKSGIGTIEIESGILYLRLPREAILKGASTEAQFLDEIVVKKGKYTFKYIDERATRSAVINSAASKPKPTGSSVNDAHTTVEYIIPTNHIGFVTVPSTDMTTKISRVPTLAVLLHDPNVKLFVALRDMSGKPSKKSEEITIPIVPKSSRH